ncbi:dachshund c isoform X1, partial [Lates japonicus]
MANVAQSHANPLPGLPPLQEPQAHQPRDLLTARIILVHSNAFSKKEGERGGERRREEEEEEEEEEGEYCFSSVKHLECDSCQDVWPRRSRGDNSSLATQTTREGCDRQVYQKPPSGREGCERVSYPAGQKLPAGLHHTPFIFPEGLSSIETLLTNIQQGLLRVAIENARAQEKQDQLERTELKMELVRERELRETLERQLSMEQKNRVLIQKRLKKEKRNKRRLQEALEEEVKLRDQAEHSLLHTANTHTGHQSSAAPPHTESVTQDVDGSSHDDNRLDTKATVQ